MAVHGVVLGHEEKHSLRQRGARLNPNAEINLANDTWEWLGKMSGAYLFRTASMVGELRAPERQPAGADRAFQGRPQIPSITVPVEPIGSIRLPNLNLLDLRAEKRFRLTKGQSLAVRVNVFNAMNINTVTARVVRSGATYLFPTAIVLPRILDFSMSYSF